MRQSQQQQQQEQQQRIRRTNGLVLLLVSLLVCCSPCSGGGGAASASVLPSGTEPQVVVEELPSTFKHAQNDQDMELLYRTCLQPDLRMHAGRNYTLRDLALTVKAQRSVRYYKHLSVVTVREGTAHVATLSPSGQAPSPTPRRVNATLQAVRDALQQGITLPDCIFILSTWDEPRCPTRAPSRCPAPVLSLVKTWTPAPQTPAGAAAASEPAKSSITTAGSSEHSDILVPFFNHVYQQVVDYPWGLKVPKALMRAAMQNGMPPRNTRLALVELSRSPEGQPLLDAGITHNLKQGMALQTVPQVSLPDHAKWRFLISADGYTASCRLGKLLGINSVVVKEATHWVEHYYRALQPHKHYVPFTRANVLLVLRDVRGRPDAELQDMARQARHFQQMYLTQHAKVLYLRQVLVRYLELFPEVDMAAFVQGLDPARLHDVRYLITELNGGVPITLPT